MKCPTTQELAPTLPLLENEETERKLRIRIDRTAVKSSLSEASKLVEQCFDNAPLVGIYASLLFKRSVARMDSLSKLCLFCNVALPSFFGADAAWLLFEVHRELHTFVAHFNEPPIVPIPVRCCLSKHPASAPAIPGRGQSPGSSSPSYDSAANRETELLVRGSLFQFSVAHSWIGGVYRDLALHKDIASEDPWLALTSSPAVTVPLHTVGAGSLIREVIDAAHASQQRVAVGPPVGKTTIVNDELFVILLKADINGPTLGLVIIKNPTVPPIALSDGEDAHSLIRHVGQLVAADLTPFVREALTVQTLQAELTKQKFLLGLTQYVCKDSMEVCRVLSRFNKFLQTCFDVCVAICFAVDEVSREVVRISGGRRTDPMALPFSNPVVRLCLDRGEPVVTPMPWRNLWDPSANCHKWLVPCVPSDWVESWLQRNSAFLTESVLTPNECACGDGPKAFLPLCSDRRAKLLLVLVHTDTGDPGQRRSSAGASDSLWHPVEHPHLTRHGSLLSTLPNRCPEVRLMQSWQQSAPAQISRESLESLAGTSGSPAFIPRSRSTLDWDFDQTFSRQFLEVLQRACDVLSSHLEGGLPRYVMQGLMLSRRRESAPSHQIIQFAFDVVEQKKSELPATDRTMRRASAPHCLSQGWGSLASWPASGSQSNPEDAHGPHHGSLPPVPEGQSADGANRECDEYIPSKKTVAKSDDLHSLSRMPNMSALAFKLRDVTLNIFRIKSSLSLDQDMYSRWRTQHIDWWSISLVDGSEFFEWAFRTLDLAAAIPNFDDGRRTRRRFFQHVTHGYRITNPYHNAFHALQVHHALWMLLHGHGMTRHVLPLESYALLIAGLCHDVDHPGFTNQFLIMRGDPLALLYNDQSVLEHHHAAFTFQAMCMRSDIDVLKYLSPPVRREARKLIIDFVLATDMQGHSQLLCRFMALIKRMNENGSHEDVAPLAGSSTDITPGHRDSGIFSTDDRSLVGCVMIHAADLSNQVLPFPWFHKWASLCVEEFNNQCDQEAAMRMEVTGYMNCRSERSRVEMELGFSNFVVLPLWRPLVQFEASLAPWVAQGERNSRFWRLALWRLDELAHDSAASSFPEVSSNERNIHSQEEDQTVDESANVGDTYAVEGTDQPVDSTLESSWLQAETFLRNWKGEEDSLFSFPSRGWKSRHS